MAKEVIDVNLYGGKGIFGGKETPLEAVVISCDKHNECSYFKNSQCLAVRSFMSTGCKFSNVNTVRGYTSRAKKYSQFKREWQEHEKYNKLTNPPTKIGLIDNHVVFPYPYVRINKDDDGKWKVKDPSFSNSKAYIPYEDFTTGLIKAICMYRPQAIFGGTIGSYQKETVPLFLAHLKEVLPEKYIEFIKEFPEYADKEVNYVGRKALLKTIKPSTINYYSRNYPELGNEWYWDGELLTYKKGYVSSVSVINDYEVAEFKLKPSDKTTVKITSNEQVTEDTVFVD